MLLCSALVARALQAEKPAKPRYTSIPPADLLLTVASPPDCPIQLKSTGHQEMRPAKQALLRADFLNSSAGG